MKFLKPISPLNGFILALGIIVSLLRLKTLIFPTPVFNLEDAVYSLIPFLIVLVIQLRDTRENNPIGIKIGLIYYLFLALIGPLVEIVPQAPRYDWWHYHPIISLLHTISSYLFGPLTIIEIIAVLLLGGRYIAKFSKKWKLVFYIILIIGGLAVLPLLLLALAWIFCMVSLAFGFGCDL